MTRLVLIFTLLIAIASCNSSKEAPVTNLTQLQNSRTAIQQNIDSLTDELKKIEANINKLDTLKKFQKVFFLEAYL